MSFIIHKVTIDLKRGLSIAKLVHERDPFLKKYQFYYPDAAFYLSDETFYYPDAAF